MTSYPQIPSYTKGFYSRAVGYAELSFTPAYTTGGLATVELHGLRKSQNKENFYTVSCKGIQL